MDRFPGMPTLVKNFELVLILAGTLLVSLLCIYFDAFEMLAEFVQGHDAWQLDEVIIVLMFGGLAALILLFPPQPRPSSRNASARGFREEATMLARHDPLTGLPNRRVLAEDLETAIQSVRDMRGRMRRVPHRSRSLQAGQRHSRPRRRRCRADRGGGAASPRSSGRRGRWPAWAATGSPASSPIGPAPIFQRAWPRQIVRSLGEPVLLDGTSIQVGGDRSGSRAPPMTGALRASCCTALILPCTRASARAEASIISSTRKWISRAASSGGSRGTCAWP